MYSTTPKEKRRSHDNVWAGFGVLKKRSRTQPDGRRVSGRRAGGGGKRKKKAE